jgi:hypothetical protein
MYATLVAFVLLLAVPRPAAAAAPPCWKQLLNDWYDGRIDKTYPIPCYQATLKHLPSDVQVYSSARDDIQRALASVILKQKNAKAGGGKTTSSVNPTGGATSTAAGTTPAPAGTATTSTEPAPVTPAPTTTTGGRKRTGPINEALDKITPGGADSLPLPLLILGGLALVLVGGGLAGMVIRHLQTRQTGP